MANNDYAAKIETQHPGLIPLLGKVTDAVVALQYGLTDVRVRTIRHKLGIARMPRAENESWVLSKALLEQNKVDVGVTSDRALAMRLGVHERHIARYRREHNIPAASTFPYPASLTPIPEEKVREMFAQGATDAEIGAAVGRTEATIALLRRKKWGLFRGVSRNKKESTK